MPVENRRFVPIFARQRSGTTALREIMGRHPSLFTYAEVFHPDYKDNPVFYYHFWGVHFQKHPEHHWPSAENRKAVFDAYLEWLDAKSKPGKIVTFNVNYNSMHSLDFFWRDLLAPPFLITLTRQKKFPVVHLVRRNLLATHISELRARETGVWHTKDPSAQAPKITVPCRSLRYELNVREAEIRHVSQWIKGLKTLDLVYEELFDGTSLTADAAQRVADFLEIEPGPLSNETSFQRTGTAKLEDALENTEEVRETLKGTRFEWMCDAL
jgi:hypothetical protein